jgi:ABC-type lipoprotein export system ATPase subunit
MGVNVFVYKVLAFTLGCFFAGIAGSFFAHFQRFVSADSFANLESFAIITMVALGGTGSIIGPILGATILVVVPEVFRFLAQYRGVIYGLTLIVVIVYRPGGLAGVKGIFEKPKQPKRPGRHRFLQRLTRRDGMILQVEKLRKAFGGLVAVNDVDLTGEKGSIHAIIGPNGAGKTTFFNALTCLNPARYGDRHVSRDRRFMHLKTFQISALGIARTFQNIRLFPYLSLLENVKIGAHTQETHSIFDAIFRTRRFRHEEKAVEEAAIELLEKVNLAGQAQRLRPQSRLRGSAQARDCPRAGGKTASAAPRRAGGGYERE